MVNTIIHGDSLTVMREMESESVDAIITDPPYGIDYQSAWKPKDRRLGKISNDKAPFIWWLYDAYRVCKIGGVLLCFCRWDVQQVFVDAIKLAGFTVKSSIVWDRAVHGMGDLKSQFAPQHDIIIFATKGAYVFPGKRPSDVIKIPRVSSTALFHPNEKPVDLMAWLITSTTERGAIVFDPFAGSGATLVAASENGRQYIGIDIDKHNCQIATDRINQVKAVTT